MMEEKTLTKKTVADLKHIAAENGIAVPSGIRKAELMQLILEAPEPTSVPTTSAPDLKIEEKEAPLPLPEEQKFEGKTPDKAMNAENADDKNEPNSTEKTNVASTEFRRSMSTQQRMGARTQPVQNSFRSAGRTLSGKPTAETQPRARTQQTRSNQQTDGNRVRAARTQKTVEKSETEKQPERRSTERRDVASDPKTTTAVGGNAESDKARNTEVQQASGKDAFDVKELGEGAGILEIHPDGYGFLRAENYLPGNHDVYVAAAQIRRFNLRTGDYVKGKIRAQQAENQSVGLIYINEVNGKNPEKARFRKPFDSLVPVYPDERLHLERDDVNDPSMRLVDIIAPIGKGQRGMIVSQPKAGKTTLLKKIANAITVNAPEVHLIVLLIDERPEEVTDMKRSISGEVIYSTFDEAPENHTRVSEMVLERAQRLVENGEDVVILLDSITRLARAYNLVIPPTGRSLSGGLDPGALYRPKRFFGAARNIENGGSLTIIATALVDTGSRMDDIIFEEFKGTGNMELHLDRSLSERRIFPAVDVFKSGTRREDLLLTPEELEGAYEMRRMLSKGNPQETYEQLISFILKTKNNEECLQKIRGWMHAFDKNGGKTR